LYQDSIWCGFTTKLELFSKILLSLRPASARKFLQNLRSKTEKFSLHFFDVARPNFFQKGKENFLFWIFAKSKKAEAELRFVNIKR